MEKVKEEPPDDGHLNFSTTVMVDHLDMKDEELISSELLREHLTSSAMETLTKRRRKNRPCNPEIKIFKCGLCKKELSDKRSLKNHLQAHTDDYQFACPMCPRRFKVDRYVARHVRRVHERRPRYECGVCAHKLYSPSALRVHSYVHTGERPYKCDQCNKTFNRSHVLRSHMLIHTGVKPYACSLCSYTCRDNSTLRKHKQRHSLDKRYQCRLCDKKYYVKAQLKVHVAERHLQLDLKKYECAHCPSRFKLKLLLVKHIRVVHEGRREFSCEVCGGTFGSSANLQTHAQRHYAQRPHACTHRGCGKTFKIKGDLKKHQAIHTVNPLLSCKKCGRNFSRPGRLKRHYKTHLPRHKATPCTVCGVRFYSQAYVDKHMAAKHNEEKETYQCDYCGLVSLNKPGLVMHIRNIHLKGMKFKCKTCGLQFKNLTPMKRHAWDVHRIRNKTKVRKLEKIKEEVLDDITTEEKVQIKEEVIDIEEHELLEPEEDYIMEMVDESDMPGALQKLVRLARSTELTESAAKRVISHHRHRLSALPETIFDAHFTNVLASEASNTFYKQDYRPDNRVYAKKEPAASVSETEAPAPRERVRHSERPRRNVPEINYQDVVSGITTTNQNGSYVGYLGLVKRKKKTNNCLVPEKKIKTDDPVGVALNELDDNSSKITEAVSAGSILQGEIEANAKNDQDSSAVKENNKDKEVPKKGVPVKAKLVNGLKRIKIGNVKQKYGKFYQMKFNTVQCYACFKLFKTHEELAEHCLEHFQLNNHKRITKCPFCNHESDRHLWIHMRRVHGIDANAPSGNISVRTDDATQETKYVISLGKKTYNKRSKQTAHKEKTLVAKPDVKEIEIVPTVLSLNTQLMREIDKQNRKRKHQSLMKRKLVKKGNEWIVEEELVPVTVDDLLDTGDISAANLDVNSKNTEKEDLTEDPYLDKMITLSAEAKAQGKTMLYPCDKCSKICSAFCGLRLHRRVHNNKAKPFKPKVWKHKQTSASLMEYAARNAEASKVRLAEKVKRRRSRPKPILPKRYKCDNKLKEFFKNNITGSDVDFEHFLKIYNKIDRTKDYEEPKYFNVAGDNLNEPNDINNVNKYNTTKKVISVNQSKRKPKKGVPICKKVSYKRVIRISRREHKNRLNIIQELRNRNSAAECKEKAVSVNSNNNLVLNPIE